GIASERAEIAGVFVRRLRKGMKLQTDPTVIYGMGERFDGNIRRRDLKEDTPYNTYVHRGLTPTPICLPGADAIHAALHPADGKSLYFVADGSGGHKFSNTLKEHNAAVRKYQLKK
ncbi:MAG: endolytic transglycosylase MltG, partial [Sedimenticola sp.]